MNKIDKKKLIAQVNIYRSVLILLFICIAATILSENFLSVSNMFNVIRQVAVGGLVACGMTFVILTGGIDLSVGSIVGLTGALSAGIMKASDNVLLAILAAMAVGILCGMINGFFCRSVWNTGLYRDARHDDAAQGLRIGLHAGLSDRN